MIFSKKDVHSNDNVDALRLINDNTPFAINEAFRALYTKVLYFPIADKCKKIAVTSAISGEGKTYLATNLAITLAKNSDNKKVLLVDLDMRKPRIARVLSKNFKELKRNSGASEYLAGIDENPNIVSLDIPNLDFLFSGKENSNALGLVNSKRMVELLDKISQEYDYVIFDTPPVSLVSDALVLADKINGYIISTRSDYSDINNVAHAVELIQNVNGEIFGIVLTAVNPKSNVKYSRSYRSTYDYYRSDSED